ncbi:MFS transporter [Pelagicoccus sp. SDUM812003]|uniref:MFS transporter n=1 Tax=Pelagicoccus sp. SDUM812003 TaxID=3041267 RepID=UPI0028100570|nr:MFS transporter [Pelagicoccus sp. SDUM812003]MDQ8203424.1 MFS transporter [Pelagicoccus sp. SDUM812003]
MKLWNPKTPFSPSEAPLHYGWAIAVVGTLGMLASVPGQTIGVNVFSERLIGALELSRINVSAAYFAGTALSGFILPYAGTLFDRFGARRLIALASVGLAASLVFMSFVDHLAGAVERLVSVESLGFAIRVATLTVGFFLIRFWGQGVVMMTSRNMIGKWWVAHRGKVFSIGGIAVAVCFSLTPQAFDWLIERVGWREAWWLMALGLAPFFCSFAWLLYRDNPQECGLEPDAGLAVDEAKSQDPEFRIVKEFQRTEALKTYSFWAFSLVFALQACYFTAFSFHVIDVAADVGMSKGGMLALFFPSAVLNGAVSLFVGWACDRWRLKYLLAFMASGNLVAALGLGLAHPVIMPACVVIGFGISGGCFGALSGVFMPRFFGLKHLGAISGFFASLIVLGSAVGPLAFSLARSFLGSYAFAHWVAGGLSLSLMVGARWANNPQRGLAKS